MSKRVDTSRKNIVRLRAEIKRNMKELTAIVKVMSAEDQAEERRSARRRTK